MGVSVLPHAEAGFVITKKATARRGAYGAATERDGINKARRGE